MRAEVEQHERQQDDRERDGREQDGWGLRLAVATEAAGIGVWEWDLADNTFLFSDGARAIYGFSTEGEITRERVRGAAHADDLPAMRARWALALDPAVRDRTPHEYRVVRTDGATRWVIGFGQALFDRRGDGARATKYIGALQDITERKTSEALRQSENRFRTLTLQAPAGLFETDRDGNCEFVNDRWCWLTGLTPEQARGAGWIAALHPDDRERVRREWYEAALWGVEFSSAYRFRTPGGEVRWVQGNALGVTDESGAKIGYIGSVTDITELRKKEARQAQLMGELNQRVKSALAAVQSMAKLTMRTAGDLHNSRGEFNSRFQALAGAHDLLTRECLDGAMLSDVVRLATNGFGPGRISAAGPELLLAPRASLSLSLALRELGANAKKHGALSVPAGRVAVQWGVTPSPDEDELTFRWIERGGPRVTPPRRAGFGTQLIQQALGTEVGCETRIDYDPQGLRFFLRCRFPHNDASAD